MAGNVAWLFVGGDLENIAGRGSGDKRKHENFFADANNISFHALW